MLTSLSLWSPPIFPVGSLEESIQSEPPTSIDDLFHLVVSTEQYVSVTDVKRLSVTASLIYTGSNFALPEQEVWLHPDPRLPVQIESQLLSVRPNGTSTVFLSPIGEGVGGIYAVLNEKENKAYNSSLYTRSNILVFLNRRVDLL